MHHLLLFLSLILQPSFSLAQLIATDTLTTTVYAVLTPSIIRPVSSHRPLPASPYLFSLPSKKLTYHPPEQNNYSSTPLRGISYPTGLTPKASNSSGDVFIALSTTATNSSVTPKIRFDASVRTHTSTVSLANSTSTRVVSATETSATSGKSTATATATAGGTRLAGGKKGAAVMAAALGGVAGGMIGWG